MLKRGKAKIYAVVTDWDGKERKDSVVFNIDYKPITGLSLNMDDTIRIIKYSEQQLTVTVSPFNATNDSVIWTSSKSSVISIIPPPAGKENDTICNIKALTVDTAKIYVASKLDPMNPLLRDSCVFIVLPIDVSKVIIPQDTVDLYLGHKMNLTASVLPSDATDKLLTWTSSRPTIADISQIVNDTDCEIIGKALGEAKIYATALDGVTKDSCVVKVKQQYVFLEADTTYVNGGIELSLFIPAGVTFTGSFELHLPKGFGLTFGEVSQYRTALADNLKDKYDLDIERLNDSTFLFTITPIVPGTSSLLSGTETKIMDIVYTIFDNNLEGSIEKYFAKLVDVNFELSNGTSIEKDLVSVPIKPFRDPTGNEMIDNPTIFAYIHANRLYVNSEKAETISIYSLNGSLLFSRDKKEGAAVFNLNTTEKTLIIRGSSGWTNKVANL
jgi:hypothetical protein